MTWRAGGTAALLAVICGLFVTGLASGRGTPVGDRYGFFVNVVGLDDKGNTHALADALVAVHPGGTAATNRKGLAYAVAGHRTLPGDNVTIEASKAGYRTETMVVQVSKDTSVREHVATRIGQLLSTLLRRHTPELTITLPPADDAGPEVELVVQVKDSGLKPVGGALVALDRVTPPIRPEAHSYTSADGEATFFVPRDLIESGLQARVFAGDRGKKFSDIPANLVEGPNPRVFLVVLSNPNAFTLDPSQTQVQNVQGPMLTIDPGGSAVYDHTGQYGGAGNGGDWKSTYGWQVPSSFTLGTTESITLTDTVSDVNPQQPLADAINVIGPGLAQQLIDHYPNGPTSMTWQYTLAADQTTDFTITVGFVSSTVTYHYVRG